MTLNFYTSQSTVKPDLLDTTSSKKVVYIRQNVVEVETTDELTGETHTYYEYEEAKLTKAEYEQYQAEVNTNETLAAIESMKIKMEELESASATIDSMSEAILKGVNEV